jgi:glutathione S-transferase
MLTLFYAPNTCALASHIALETAGARYEAVRISFAEQEQRSAQYLRINPKGRVPALVTERGILTETPAILQFIAQTHPQARLAPLDDAFEMARLNAFNSYLCSTVHVAHAHRMRGYRWADDPAALEAMKKKVPQSVGDCFELIEREYFAGPWVLGERYSVSDMYLFTLANWLEADGVDPARFPKVSAHRDRLRADPAVKRVLATHAA